MRMWNRYLWRDLFVDISGVVVFLASIAGYIGVIYIAVHFIRKYW